ncbi:MAG: MurR/RpiR family transcriptional regulator, partial [Albimonas sp.]|uniref:MurR/RpiR family transcriptional regulator n=1 Tax=Albimonas sp. TaxID=1872425 RepID=UPI00405673BD
MTAEPIGQRILAAYDDMPRGERRLADLLLEDLGALRHENAGSLAERAGVSKATAARLFRRLGYAGYKAAQREARAGTQAP